MQDVKEYREAIYQAMIAMTDAEGNPLVSAEEAKAILEGFTDEELAKAILEGFTDEELEDGILYNSPEEVAGFLLLD